MTLPELDQIVQKLEALQRERLEDLCFETAKAHSHLCRLVEAPHEQHDESAGHAEEHPGHADHESHVDDEEIRRRVKALDSSSIAALLAPSVLLSAVIES